MKKAMMVLLFLVLTIQLANFSYATEILPDGAIAIHIGSPLIFSDNRMISLDSDNPDVVPNIHKDRTLVPLRAISEHFGAIVSYDITSREALIEVEDEKYFFPIGKNHYRMEKEGFTPKIVYYDTEALIIQDRTMVPLRLITEDVFNKMVGYKDQVITISNERVNLDQDMVNVLKTKIGQVLKVSSLSELQTILAAMSSNITEDKYRESEPMPSGETSASSDEDASKSNDYATTNEQVDGVNEADIVKTDGRFIYVALGNSVKVYDSNGGKPILTDEITLEVDDKTGQYLQLNELYISDGRLVILGSKNSFDNWIRPIMEPSTDEAMLISKPYDPGTSYIYCGVYTIDDKGKMALMKTFEIEGSLLSSRKKEDVVYLVVNKHLNDYSTDEGAQIPMFRDTSIKDTYQPLPVNRIMYHPNRVSQNYLIISAIDIRNEEKPASINAFLGSGNLVYMSNQALYVAGQDYSTSFGNITNIAKFNIDGLKVGFAGGGMVEGSILNQFSMDEFGGNLRVATTSWQMESTNALYVLDENLNVLGASKNIAPGERIYSVRFMGEKCYMVTFRQVDPLFVIDLSNPQSPEVIGELKVPGFSNYLHPISETVLLGIGQNIDEITGNQTGIKLSTFDVSDGGKPREIMHLILGDGGSYAEVLSNHKALMVNPAKNRIAFDATLRKVTGEYQSNYYYGAMILEVTKNGDISLLKQISADRLFGSTVKRVIYIGDVLYYILDDNIKTYNFETFEEIE